MREFIIFGGGILIGIGYCLIWDVLVRGRFDSKKQRRTLYETKNNVVCGPDIGEFMRAVLRQAERDKAHNVVH